MVSSVIIIAEKTHIVWRICNWVW